MRTQKYLPFFISFSGCILDYISTSIGLSLGFYETHLTYSLLNALIIFTVANSILYYLPHLMKYKIIFSSFSYLGFVNNIYVLLQII